MLAVQFVSHDAGSRFGTSVVTVNAPHAACLGSLFCAALVCGCQRAQGPERMAVGGTVTRAGVPLATGLISFRPARGGNGPAANTSIQEGRYQFDATNGPTAGPHEVLIQKAFEGKPTAVTPNEAAAAADVSLPWTFEIDVPANSRHEIPFQLP
jgi:hypothetical protein